MKTDSEAIIGRPTIYTPELGEEICLAIATSSKGLEKLCKEHPHWPSHNAIYEWRIKHKDFGEKYARAKQNQVEALIDQILDIADDTSQDIITSTQGNTLTNHEHINRSRLRIDTRKWLAAKLAPKLYGGHKQIMPNINNTDDDWLEELKLLSS